MKSLKQYINEASAKKIKPKRKYIMSDELYDELRSEMYEEGFELFDDKKRTKITAYPIEVSPTNNNRIFMIDLANGGEVVWFKSEPYEFKVTYKIQRILGLED